MMYARSPLHKSAVSSTPARKYPDEEISSLQDQMREAEHVADDMGMLLTRCPSMLEREGMKKKVEELQRWAEVYRNGLDIADRMLKNDASHIFDRPTPQDGLIVLSVGYLFSHA